MKRSQSQNNSKKIKNGTNGFVPSSFKFISSCIKTVSSNVRSAGASVASSISASDASDDQHKDQVLWACFDRLEVGPSSIKRVLLIGYSNGFQVLDVEDASDVCELVSRRDDPVTFLQMLPIPEKSDGVEGFRKSHPLLLVVASDENADSNVTPNCRDNFIDPHGGTSANSPTSVRFYSLRSHNYVQNLRFRSTVYMVRCSPRIVAVGLAAQIHCFDALTLENKFSVLTYPLPQLGGSGITGVNIGHGPMAVGPRWLAYASNHALLSNTGRLTPQSLSPSPGVSPSTSPGSGNLVAKYAMESSKQLAAGLINLGDMSYKTLSKYCQELLPDGSSSPVSASASWKVGRVAAHSPETDAAGVVAIKDIVSREVISQFRAHSSPISSLCFDPSGTLLVTSSVRGNSINIFKITLSMSQHGSGARTHDWSSCHVHLYKLHRGVTPAVIQDICFSSFSQWVAIISSRGTCHIFVLSPFGGETGLQLKNSEIGGSTLFPLLTPPWWSTSSFSISPESSSHPPPTPVALSVVSRIKSGGWLNTVSNAASSAAGKVSVPSGVIAAVFHNSVRQHTQPASFNASVALEHLLAYSPSGHLIQYDLMASGGGEQGDSSSINRAGTLVQMQEDELGVKVEPVQWWDVCRRSAWPEREECIQGITLGGREAIMGTSQCEDNRRVNFVKHNDQSHWYLSNAEVQLKSGRVPIWQKSKVHFYTMGLNANEELNITEDHGGETKIEEIPVSEVELKHKDLLPVFDHFQRIHLNLNTQSSKQKSEDHLVYHAKAASPHASEKSLYGEPGSLGISSDEMTKLVSYPRIDLVVDTNDTVITTGPISNQSLLSQRSVGGTNAPPCPESPANLVCFLEERSVNSSHFSRSYEANVKETNAREVQSSTGVVIGDTSKSNSSIIDQGPTHEDTPDPVDFGQFFQEGYCDASTEQKSDELTGVGVHMDGSNNPCDKDKKEGGETNDVLEEGVFAFFEEG